MPPSANDKNQFSLRHSRAFVVDWPYQRQNQPTDDCRRRDFATCEDVQCHPEFRAVSRKSLSGSLADKAGLKGGQAKIELLGQSLWIGGDIILEIQKTVCESPHDFNSIREKIDALEPGHQIAMKVLRGGKVIDLAIKL